MAVAGHPARQFLVRIGATRGVDLGHVGRVFGELDDEAVGRGDIDRLAVAVIGLAVVLAGPLKPPFQLVVGIGSALKAMWS